MTLKSFLIVSFEFFLIELPTEVCLMKVDLPKEKE